MRKERQIVTEPEKLPYPYRVIRKIEGQGVEVEIDFPDTPAVESEELKLLKKIAAKLGVEV